MATPRSPFLVIRDFISPKFCENIVYDIGFTSVDFDTEGNPLVMKRTHDKAEDLVFDKIKATGPVIEQYYGIKHRGTERVMFEFYCEGTKCEPQCENSRWVNKKWVRVRDRDLSAILFLSSYQDNIPFDNDFEVYGGKLEFFQHQFGFNPERGTLIVFPSGPHFINALAPIIAGELFLARFHIAAALPYLYDPREFPGDYKTWFEHLT